LATGSPCENKLPPECALFFHGVGGVHFHRMSSLLRDGHQYLDVLFPQAANNDTTCKDEREMLWQNVHSSINVFEWAIANGCQKIVYASSTAVYGKTPAPQREDGPVDPLNAYARSKLELEKVTRHLSVRYPHVTFIGLRYCNVYGPGEHHKGKRASMIHQVGKRIVWRPVKLFEHGEQKRDWIFVDDVVRANLMAMEADRSCVVNCGSGVATTFNRIHDILADLYSKWSWGGPCYIPNPEPEKYQDHTECDMALAKKHLGFVPKYDIEAGIRENRKRWGFG